MYDPLNHKVVQAHKFKQYIVQPHNVITSLSLNTYTSLASPAAAWS